MPGRCLHQRAADASGQRPDERCRDEPDDVLPGAGEQVVVTCPLLDWSADARFSLVAVRALRFAPRFNLFRVFLGTLHIAGPRTHRRAQPLRTEGRNAKNVRKSAMHGIPAPELTPICGVLWVAAFCFAKSSPKHPATRNPGGGPLARGSLFGQPLTIHALTPQNRRNRLI